MKSLFTEWWEEEVSIMEGCWPIDKHNLTLAVGSHIFTWLQFDDARQKGGFQ